MVKGIDDSCLVSDLRLVLEPALQRGEQAPLSAALLPDVGLPGSENTAAQLITRSLPVFILDATGTIHLYYIWMTPAFSPME